jgi:protein SCO1/2
VIAARIERRRLLAFSAAAGGLAVGVGWQALRRPTDDAAGLPAPLGGIDARLVDHEGRDVGFPDLVGRAAMVFFGFTSCPDVCPTTLGDIATWLDALGDAAAQVTPVFVTVDPARDDAATLAAYAPAFHPAIRGWTGAPDQIARAARALRVSYREVPLEGGGYTMDHTAGVMLFQASGRFMSIIDPHENPDFAVPKLRRAIGG